MSLKKVLTKVSADAKIKFLEKMAFANGTLINIKTGGVGSTLTGNETIALMQSCGTTTTGYACDAFVAGQCFESAHIACDAAACKGNKGFPVVTLGSLLKGVPTKNRNQFLQSLEFNGGRLTKVDPQPLAGHLSPEKLKELPRVRSKK